MRIVGGAWSGQTLWAPPGRDTRPTTDGVRQALFNILEHGLGHEPCRVLDLFAGTGALSFEALSRGAKYVLLTECDRKALDAIQRNQDQLKVAPGSVGIIETSKTEKWGALIEREAKGQGLFDTIFCDPPYEKNLVAKAMRSLSARSAALFSPGALLVAEVSEHEKAPALGDQWELIQERVRGSTGLYFYRWKPESLDGTIST